MRKMMINLVLSSLGLAALLIPALPLAPTLAHAHSWYDADCCSGSDCERIAVTQIAFLENGNMRMRDAGGTDWLVNVRELRSRLWIEHPDLAREAAAPYDAWMRSRDADELPPGAIKRVSQDGEYHLCVFRGQVQCVYLPADR